MYPYSGGILDDLGEIRNHLNAGGDFSGHRVCWTVLREVLLDRQPSERSVVRNCVVVGFGSSKSFEKRLEDIQGGSFSSAVRFVGCTFAGSSWWQKDVFERSLAFEHCRFEAELRFCDCLFRHGLELNHVEIVGHTELTHCQMPTVPALKFVCFGGNLILDRIEPLEGRSWDGQIWSIPGCCFSREFRLDAVSSEVALGFNDCRFEAGGFTQFLWSNAPIECGFYGCLLAGRVLLRVESTKKQLPSKTADEWATVKIDGSTISGEVDLHLLPIKEFDLNNTTIDGGRLWIEKPGLSEPRKGWKDYCLPWRWAPVDRIGRLAHERKLAGLDCSDESATTSSPKKLDCFRWIANQYEELRNSFSVLPFTDWEEDFCHYKCMDFHRRYRVGRLGIKAFTPTTGTAESEYDSRRGLKHFWKTLVWFVLILLLFVSAACCGNCWWTAACLFAAGVACTGMWAYHREYQFTLGEVLRDAFDFVVLKWFLGYGIYVHRILVWAAATMVAFAAFFWVILLFFPEFGDIHDGNGNQIVLEERLSHDAIGRNVGESPRLISKPLLFGRLLYFSSVTFTTLGYGDMHPVGWLKPIAAGEAMLGAVTIALLTVVFARRFIRR